ncbi:MAG: MarP family serine protease [Jatrophihabitantaceae bacterium]
MDILDLVIVVAAVAYGIGGFRNGAVVGAMSMIGFFGGAVLGAQLADPIGSRLAHGEAQVPVAIVCVLVVSVLGQLLAAWAAGRIRGRIIGKRGRVLDAGVGSALGIVAVLLVAWMVAVPLRTSPYPTLAAEAQQSRIVKAVDGVLPTEADSLYSSLRELLSRQGFPPIFGGLQSAPIVSVPPPDAALTPAVAAQVRSASRSIFKIYGEAPSCSRGIEGSGFVYAPHRLLTNAHVVAGTDQLAVQVGHRMLAATVVRYDPARDVAVLDVPGLDAPALQFASRPARSGDPALVLGYPQDGPFTVRAARVRSRTTVQGSDIYGNGTVRREIYAIRAVVRSGNSGGPLLADDGTVLGIVFATAVDASDTGYVLSDAEIAPDASAGANATAPVSTGACTPG